MPLVLYGDGCQAGLDHLPGQTADLAAESHIWLQARRIFGRNRRRVYRVGDGPGIEVVGHLLGDLQGDLFLRLRRCRTEMRRGNNLLHSEHAVAFRRLLRKDVDRKTGDLSRFDRSLHIRLDHKLASGTVHYKNAIPHFCEIPGIQDTRSRIRKRRMKGDDFCTGEQIVQFHLFDAEGLGAFRRQERIRRNHFHSQSHCAVGNDGPDIAATDDAENLAGKLDSHEFGFFPPAGLRRLIGEGYLAGECEHHGDRMLGGRDRISERSVHDDDAAAGCRVDIDIVYTDTGAADHFEIIGRRQYFRRHLGGRPDRKAVIFADAGDQFFRLHPGNNVGFDAVGFKDINGSITQAV